MSSWALAVVLIVAIVSIAQVLQAKHRARHGITTDYMGNEKVIERENSELKREVEELRERIKVLERIATEDRETKLLSAEIESLRENERKVQ